MSRRAPIGCALGLLCSLAFAPAAFAASPERLPSVPTSRECPQVLVPELFPGGSSSAPEEIDIFGRGAPSCGQAVHLLRLAPTRIASGRWGRVGAWRCVWKVALEECRRGSVRLFASNPGD
jgi:hypothetical protein